jgi:hypothetical protein
MFWIHSLSVMRITAVGSQWSPVMPTSAWIGSPGQGRLTHEQILRSRISDVTGTWSWSSDIKKVWDPGPQRWEVLIKCGPQTWQNFEIQDLRGERYSSTVVLRHEQILRSRTSEVRGTHQLWSSDMNKFWDPGPQRWEVLINCGPQTWTNFEIQDLWGERYSSTVVLRHEKILRSRTSEVRGTYQLWSSDINKFRDPGQARRLISSTVCATWINFISEQNFEKQENDLILWFLEIQTNETPEWNPTKHFEWVCSAEPCHVQILKRILTLDKRLARYGMQCIS